MIWDRASSNHSSPSIAARFRKTCWNRSCSATNAAPSPARSSRPSARSKAPITARCSWTRSATCRTRCRSSCCASCRTRSSSGSAAGNASRLTCGSSPPPIRAFRTRVDEGLFRGDLFYRMNAVTVRIPPLRDRGGDALLLANYFLSRFNREFGRNHPRLHRSRDHRVIVPRLARQRARIGKPHEASGGHGGTADDRRGGSGTGTGIGYGGAT